MRTKLLLAGVAFAVALGAAACASHEGDSHDNAKVAPGAREIAVTAKSFAYDPETIQAAAGEDLAIVLTSEDIFHDFVVEEGERHVVGANGGETRKGGVRFDEPGRYTFYCSVAGHRSAGMEGTLVVE